MFIRNFFIICSLTACVSSNQSSLTKAVSVAADESLIISAPKGFCVDQKMAKKVAEAITIFVVDCISVEGSKGTENFRRPISTILTATIIGPVEKDLVSVEQLQEFFTTQPGINYLSRSNSTAILKVHKVERKNEVLILLIEQRPINMDANQSKFFWRAFFLFERNIISLTASNFSENESAVQNLKKLILEFSQNILIGNSA